MAHHDGKLWAISDLHCNRPATWKYINEMASHNDDWIIIAGDVFSSFMIPSSIVGLIY